VIVPIDCKPSIIARDVAAEWLKESADSCAGCSTFSESHQFKRSVNAHRLGIQCQDIGYTEKSHDIGYKNNQEDGESKTEADCPVKR
jgi:hypothetical protein